MERQKLILGLQAVSAIGILVLGLLSYFGQSTRELRVEMKEGFAAVRDEFAAVRKEMKDDRKEMRDEFAAVRKEMRDEFAAVRKEMRDEFAAVRKETKDEFATVRKEISELTDRVGGIDTRLGRVEGYLRINVESGKPAP